jgi:hypothetical protein
VRQNHPAADCFGRPAMRATLRLLPHHEYGGHQLPNCGHAAFEYYGRNMVREGQAHYRLYEIWQS